MNAKLMLPAVLLAFAPLAFGADSDVTTRTATGTTEVKTDTTHNVLTGNDTATKTVTTRNDAGKITSKRKAKVKRNHKTGHVIEKSVNTESTETH
jgi:hypothetical protein